MLIIANWVRYIVDWPVQRMGGQSANRTKIESDWNSTYSVDSTVGVVGIIIKMQLTRMVVMINNENNGCTKM